jgi:hypothetical protein
MTMKEVNAIMASGKTTPVYGELTEVSELTFPENVTATIEVRDPDTGEMREVTETCGFRPALTNMLVHLDRSASKPKKRGRKAAVDPMEEVLDHAEALARAAIMGTSMRFTVDSGNAAVEMLAQGRCAVFLAYVCEPGSVLGIDTVDDDGVTEAVKITILRGPNEGETSDTLFPDPKETTVEPGHEPPVSQGQPEDPEDESNES